MKYFLKYFRAKKFMNFTSLVTITIGHRLNDPSSPPIARSAGAVDTPPPMTRYITSSHHRPVCRWRCCPLLVRLADRWWRAPSCLCSRRRSPPTRSRTRWPNDAPYSGLSCNAAQQLQSQPLTSIYLLTCLFIYLLILIFSGFIATGFAWYK